MTEEERSLLLSDILMRVPYGLKIQIGKQKQIYTISNILDDGLVCCVNENDQIEGYDVELIKPLLRKTPKILIQEKDIISIDYSFSDWLIKNMYDHNKLIERGLAVEAPDDMYPGSAYSYKISPKWEWGSINKYIYPQAEDLLDDWFIESFQFDDCITKIDKG